MTRVEGLFVILLVAVSFEAGQLFERKDPPQEKYRELKRYDPSRAPQEYVDECRRQDKRFVARKNEDGIWTYDCI